MIPAAAASLILDIRCVSTSHEVLQYILCSLFRCMLTFASITATSLDAGQRPPVTVSGLPANEYMPSDFSRDHGCNASSVLCGCWLSWWCGRACCSWGDIRNYNGGSSSSGGGGRKKGKKNQLLFRPEIVLESPEPPKELLVVAKPPSADSGDAVGGGRGGGSGGGGTGLATGASAEQVHPV